MSDSPVYTDEQRRKPDLSGVSAGDLDWVHPSVSNGSGGMCVELAFVPGGVALRDSANPDVMVGFSRGEVDAFLAGVVAGEFDGFRLLADRASARATA
ncbi:DUF397 domain-containing protein [Frankia sp. AgB1.9]|uniref:DUF397 domain-containing protein n=1 Tax=unclassified Frankia TaxID=2632575 RepID=UPI0019343D8F|nr:MULTISPECIES: DUF397 domain-containing protein [unclassified Frankia]MBL7490226.1 DUF397 domain-containing protein [Frankia sp. AgW1.1]MBL7548643.1 DUF397 domain-containing protein [Frankia sp. AgB1.9]MBL7623502.1 DUF397 domain-containing protein [Frankia sp. AgB1.8]